MRHHLYQTCLDHGFTALSQLQQVMRVSDQADHDSVIALLLWRLDEQSLEISCRWARASVPGRLVSEILEPRLCAAWRLKEAWTGCKELDSDVQRKWVEAKQCLSVLRQLGRTGILTLHALQELDGSGAQWAIT